MVYNKALMELALLKNGERLGFWLYDGCRDKRSKSGYIYYFFTPLHHVYKATQLSDIEPMSFGCG